MRKVVLATDGSVESEKALPIAWRIAQSQDAELVLVRVVEPVTESLISAGGDVSPSAFQRFSEAARAEAEAHLAKLGARTETSVRQRIVLLDGPVEPALLDFEAAEQPDVVVMATHGRTGIVRFALGSVADRLVREGVSPVLIVRREDPATAVLRRA